MNFRGMKPPAEDVVHKAQPFTPIRCSQVTLTVANLHGLNC
jgi:hypothetical protein